MNSLIKVSKYSLNEKKRSFRNLRSLQNHLIRRSIEFTVLFFVTWIIKAVRYIQKIVVKVGKKNTSLIQNSFIQSNSNVAYKKNVHNVTIIKKNIISTKKRFTVKKTFYNQLSKFSLKYFICLSVMRI